MTRRQNQAAQNYLQPFPCSLSHCLPFSAGLPRNTRQISYQSSNKGVSSRLLSRRQRPVPPFGSRLLPKGHSGKVFASGGVRAGKERPPSHPPGQKPRIQFLLNNPFRVVQSSAASFSFQRKLSPLSFYCLFRLRFFFPAFARSRLSLCSTSHCDRVLSPISSRGGVNLLLSD